MIFFYFEDIDTFELDSPDVYINWFNKVIEKENKKLGDITIIFCSDDYLLNINNKYLEHDYFTDIITFDYSESVFLSGDLFISTERIKDNAVLYNNLFLNELNRVIIHGILHLCGYKDKTKEENLLMRVKENEALYLLK